MTQSIGEPCRSSGAGGDAPHSVRQSSVMDGSEAQVRSSSAAHRCVRGQVSPPHGAGCDWSVAVTAWLEGLGSPPCKGEVIASLLHPALGCHPCPSSIGTGSGCLLFLVFLGLPQTLPGVSPPRVPPRCMMVRNRGVKERRGLGGSGDY